MKRILLSIFAVLMTAVGIYAEDFKITSSDPAAGECAGIAKSSYWKFSTNMDSDPTFKAVKYEFYEATTQSSLYNTVATKASKYVTSSGMWEIKNYSTAIADFKQGHTIYLIITALDNEAPTLANVLGRDTITYIGTGSSEYEYSPAKIVDQTPALGTELKSGSDNTFTLTFSQGVQLDASQSHIVTGQMATASFTSMTHSDDYTIWTIVAPSSVIEATTPALQFNIYGKDMDGKTLEGNTNGAYRMEEKSYYKFKYSCLLGSPSLVVTPAAGVVTSLKDFKISYSGGVGLSWNSSEPITVVSESGDVVSTVELENITFQNASIPTWGEFSLSSEITTPGKYTLCIPSKIFSLGTEYVGYTSKSQTVDYTIEGEELSAVISPAEGTELETMPNISVSFSDASAVGYANYVITDLNPADTLNAVIMSGDLKKQSDGTWATKYLSMYEIKLYAGHSYEVRIKAYATEMDYNYGNDPMAQFTSVVKGTSVGFQYSDVTVESTMPENNAIITSGDFTITFSDAVASVTAFVNGNSYGTPCEVVPGNDGNKTWSITIPESVISTATGSLNVNIVALDAEGLYVHGNTYADPDTVTIVTYNCYEGAPTFAIEPADGSTVKEIKEITCSYEGKINPAWGPDSAYIMCGDEVVFAFNSNDVTVNSENTAVTITIPEAITKPGTYQVIFPAAFFALGEEFAGCSSKQQTVTYIIPSHKGDVNDDGVVDIADVNAVLSIIYSEDE